MTSGGRSAYDKVVLAEVEVGQQILVTFDVDKIPDSSRNPGLEPTNPHAVLFIAGRRTGVLVGTVAGVQVEKADRLTVTTEHGVIHRADERCPTWRIKR